MHGQQNIENKNIKFVT